MDLDAPSLRVLGPVDLVDRAGVVHGVPGHRLQGLWCRLVSPPGQVVSTDTLIDAVWVDGLPAAPLAALQAQVFRLRRLLAFDGAPSIVTRAPGYQVELGAATVDAIEFERLIREASVAEPTEAVDLLETALGLWRGLPYAGFEDVDHLRSEQVRLEELRCHAIEAHADALLSCGRAQIAVAHLEAFVTEQPLRPEACATLMRALAATGRDADALRVLHVHRTQLVDELGLEPSPDLRRLETSILRGELTGDGGTTDVPAERRASSLTVDGMRLHRLSFDGDAALAWGELGTGSPVVVVPAWISHLDLIASGRDPRSVADRATGAASSGADLRSARHRDEPAGDVSDYGVEAAVDELEAVTSLVGEPVALVAMSGAGPIAITLAVRRPELVSHLALFGTYASGPKTFGDIGRPIVDLLRQRPGLASELLAGLYRPGASGAATAHFARALRESAPAEVAAGYLEAIYDTDVEHLVVSGSSAGRWSCTTGATASSRSPGAKRWLRTSHPSASSPRTVAGTCPTAETSTAIVDAMEDLFAS